MRNTKESFVFAASAALMLFAATGVAKASPSATRYRITVQNVTAGNVLSPPLAVVHTPSFELFTVGEPASPGIAAIAETGSTEVLETELEARREVLGMTKAEGGPVMAGQKAVIEISVPDVYVYFGAQLNLAAMIGRSNDSFVSLGTDVVSLRTVQRGRPIVVHLTNFDAGSEEDTGNVGDFGPRGHPTANAEGIVSYDRGLNPNGDAPETFRWGSTAAIVTIERL